MESTKDKYSKRLDSSNPEEDNMTNKMTNSDTNASRNMMMSKTQDKINPDVFKKIFNRNYQRISNNIADHTKEIKSGLTSCTSKLSSVMHTTTDKPGLLNSAGGTDESSSVSLDSILNSSSECSTESSDGGLFCLKSSANLQNYNNNTRKLENKFKNELDLMLSSRNQHSQDDMDNGGSYAVSCYDQDQTNDAAYSNKYGQSTPFESNPKIFEKFKLNKVHSLIEKYEFLSSSSSGSSLSNNSFSSGIDFACLKSSSKTTKSQSPFSSSRSNSDDSVNIAKFGNKAMFIDDSSWSYKQMLHQFVASDETKRPSAIDHDDPMAKYASPIVQDVKTVLDKVLSDDDEDSSSKPPTPDNELKSGDHIGNDTTNTNYSDSTGTDSSNDDPISDINLRNHYEQQQFYGYVKKMDRIVECPDEEEENIALNDVEEEEEEEEYRAMLATAPTTTTTTACKDVECQHRDETLKDAENLSDCDLTDTDDVCCWTDDIPNDASELVVAKHGDNNDLKVQNEAANNMNMKHDAHAVRPTLFESHNQNDDGNNEDNASKQIIKLIEKSNGNKVSDYRCDASVLYDYDNNVSFCKLCKNQAVSPTNAVLRHGIDKHVQFDLGSCTKEDLRVNYNGYCFTEFDYGEQNPEQLETRLSFDYDLNDCDGIYNLKAVNLNDNECLVRCKSKRNNLQLQCQADWNTGKLAKSSHDAQRHMETVPGHVKSKISKFESNALDQARTRATTTKVQCRSDKRATSENRKQLDDEVSQSKANRTQLPAHGTAGARQRPKQLYSNAGFDNNVRININDSKTSVNILMTENVSRNGDEIESDLEEVEIIINIDNPVSDYGGDMSPVSSRTLECIVRDLVPFHVAQKYPDRLKTIVNGLEALLRNNKRTIRTTHDVPDDIVDYIRTACRDLCDDDETQGSDMLDFDNTTTTHVTVVKDFRDHSNRSNNNADDDDASLHIDEETLYIVERTQQVHDIDNEIRKNFELKSKQQAASTGVNGTHASKVATHIGHSSPKDHFSIDALYDLNKHVVHKNQMQQLCDQHDQLKVLLGNMLHDMNRKRIVLHATDNDKDAQGGNDFQLHLLKTEWVVNNLKITQRDNVIDLLVITYDKTSGNRNCNFNGQVELLHTRQSIEHYRFLTLGSNDLVVASPCQSHETRAHVVGRLNVIYFEDIVSTTSQVDKAFSFAEFSLIKPQGPSEITSTNYSNYTAIKKKKKKYFVHVKYFDCRLLKKRANDVNDEFNVVDCKESLIDMDHLPDQVKIQFLHECNRFLQVSSVVHHQRTGTVGVNNETAFKYANDNIELPTLVVLSLDGLIIQNHINRKRDDIINRALSKYSMAPNGLSPSSSSSSLVVELDEFIMSIENELNSYLICERVINRTPETIDSSDLVKLNKLDGLISFDVVRKYSECLNTVVNHRFYTSCSAISVVTPVVDPLASPKFSIRYVTSRFYLIDHGKYYKCEIPLNCWNDNHGNEDDNDDDHDYELLTGHSDLLEHSSSSVIRTMDKRQNYIFSRHLKSMFPVGQSNASITSRLGDIRSVQLMKPRPPNSIDKPDSQDDSDDDKATCSLLTVTSAKVPSKQFRISIDYDRKEVKKEEMIARKRRHRKPRHPIQMAANDSPTTTVHQDLKIIDDQSHMLHEIIHDETIKQSDKHDQVHNESASSLRYTYDLTYHQPNKCDETQMPSMVTSQNYVQSQMPTDIDLYDVNNVKSMERRILRDGMIMNEIDRMFHSIRDHQSSSQKTSAEADASTRQTRKRSNSWSYSSNKRHVRAKIMEFDTYRAYANQTNSRQSRSSLSSAKSSSMQSAKTMPMSAGNTNQDIFLRIDDFLNPDVSQVLTRSYSCDYLSQQANIRTRIRYIRIPGEIRPTGETKNGYNSLPPEYRTVPYGLRYWSILKLLQEETESGQPYVSLGDAYLGVPPHNWYRSESIVEEILRDCYNLNKFNSDLIISNTQEIFARSFNLDNLELSEFMSIDNLAEEIETIKRNEDHMRKYKSESFEQLSNDYKDKQRLYASNHVSTVRTTKDADRIIPLVEKVDLNSAHKKSVDNRTIVTGNSNSRPKLAYNRFLDFDYGGRLSKKYHLIDDVICDNQAVDVRSLIGKLDSLEACSTGSYGRYYEDMPISVPKHDDFVGIESLLSTINDSRKDHVIDNTAYECESISGYEPDYLYFDQEKDYIRSEPENREIFADRDSNQNVESSDLHFGFAGDNDQVLPDTSFINRIDTLSHLIQLANSEYRSVNRVDVNQNEIQI